MYIPNIAPGLVRMYGNAAAPIGWLLCDGSAVSRTLYVALFTAIGTTWGVGDGATTFNVPDLRGTFPIGSDDTYTIADTGGAATVTLTSNEMAAHTHVQNAHTHAVTDPQHTHTNNMAKSIAEPGPMPPNELIDTSNATTINSATTGITLNNQTGVNQTTGVGGAHQNLPAYLSVVGIIKY